jgi:hypothetical protein
MTERTPAGLFESVPFPEYKVAFFTGCRDNHEIPFLYGALNMFKVIIYISFRNAGIC